MVENTSSVPILTGIEAPSAVPGPNGSGPIFGLHGKHAYFGLLEFAGRVRNSIGLFALNKSASPLDRDEYINKV